MSTDLVKPNGNGDPVKSLVSYLNARQKNLAQYAASGLRPETLIRLAVFEFSQNEQLRRCEPATIYSSLILAAQVGLEPSGIRGEAYLVPLKGRCNLWPGWRGYVKLALESKAVTSLYSHVVYERDHYKVWLGSDVKIEHEPYLGAGGAGDIIGAYAVAKLSNGAIDVEPMTLDELQHIRKTSAGKNNPAYNDHESEMYRKAPIRRIAKRLPLGRRFQLAAKADELSETGEQETLVNFIDAESTDVTDAKTTSDNLTEAIGKKAEEIRATKEQR